MNKRTVSLASALVASLLLSTCPASAETGRYNLHLSALGPVPSAGEVSFDWQLAPPFALELRAGGGVVPDFGQRLDGIFYAEVGARFRFADDGSGYLDEGGSIAGNFWLSPSLGFFASETSAGFLVDATVGYEFSIVSPVSLGLFFRGGVAIGDFIAPVLAGGLNISIEFEPIRAEPRDRDQDGVFDQDDACPRTPVGLPVDAAGCSDEDQDTVIDPSDACPGTAPGETVDSTGCPDTDRDGVHDGQDACPGTPPESNVDRRGCVILPPQLVLEGIVFELGSAEILPASERPLLYAAQALRDNPDVRVEIGGHTDDIGSATANRELSLARARSVRDWLITNGVDASRLEVQGYGMSEPRVPNTDDASRAQNRRIEFRQR